MSWNKIEVSWNKIWLSWKKIRKKIKMWWKKIKYLNVIIQEQIVTPEDETVTKVLSL